MLLTKLIYGAVSFTHDEITLHHEKLPIIVDVASKCLKETYSEHREFYSVWGVSKFYGDRKKEYATRKDRIEALKLYNAPIELVEQLEPISCIGLTMRCLKKAFVVAGAESTWNKIYTDLAINKSFNGMNLQTSLQKLGWKILYWNPEPNLNKKWDEEDKQLNPLAKGKVWNAVWGGHEQRYQGVIKKGIYYNVKVDDSKLLVDFKRSVPEFFEKIPFFIGTAHAGYHVFPGFDGVIIEAHSMRSLNSVDNLEKSLFNPLDQKGGPRWTRSEKYRSGLIVVPPGLDL